jgi:hypothetical protein
MPLAISPAKASSATLLRELWLSQLPIANSYFLVTVNSSLRFRARPSSLSFDATGRSCP